MIAIYCEKGKVIGNGHAVRMTHLINVLAQRHAAIFTGADSDEMTSEVGRDSLLAKMRHGRVPATIVDVALNDDTFLCELRPLTDVLVVIVGAGHTIMPRTHYLADIVVYQNNRSDNLKIPGLPTVVLEGMDYLILNPALRVGEKKLRTVVSYFGAGFDDAYRMTVADALEDAGYDVMEFRPDRLAEPNEWVSKLAEAEFYVGSMGMAAYEAVFSGCKTVAVPLTREHRMDAYWTPSIALPGLGSPDLIGPIVPETILDVMSEGGLTVWSEPNYGVYRVAAEILKRIEK